MSQERGGFAASVLTAFRLLTNPNPHILCRGEEKAYRSIFDCTMYRVRTLETPGNAKGASSRALPRRHHTRNGPNYCPPGAVEMS
eukprot:3334035-Prymnesium_polylepis.1